MNKIFIIYIMWLHTTCAIKNVLILGGDGMMGSATTRLFMKEKSRFNLTLVNRGNWYWDSEEEIKPFVNSYECTRGDGFRDTCIPLYNDLYYDAIIDFSCYHPLDMEVRSIKSICLQNFNV